MANVRAIDSKSAFEGLEAAREEPFGQHGWRLEKALERVVDQVPTPAVVADLLRLAMSACDTHEALKAVLALRKRDPAIAAVVKRFQKFPLADEADYHRVFGSW